MKEHICQPQTEISEAVGKSFHAEDLLGRREEGLLPLREQQFEYIRTFYQLPRESSDELRQLRRWITQQMAINQLDLTLRPIIDMADESEFNRIGLLQVLRAGLEIVSDPVVEHFLNRLQELGLNDMEVDLWAIGLSRVRDSKVAEMYFEHYGSGKVDNTLVLLAEWGMGVGQTVVTCINRLQKVGVPPSSVIVIPFVALDGGLGKWREMYNDPIGDTVRLVCSVTGEPSIYKDGNPYFNKFHHPSGQTYETDPIDWGEAQWGMEDEADSPQDKRRQLSVFMGAFSQYYPSVSPPRLRELELFYSNKFGG